MSTYSSKEEQQLWENWHQNRDQEAANELVKKYFHLVSYHVQRIAAHLPNSVSKDDIKSLGLLGLYDALEKFDIGRDLKFDTYASFRIRGAIIDGLRKEDWLPRSVRDKTKKVEAMLEKLEQTLQRAPSSKEIGDKLGMTAEEVEEALKDSLFANVLSIEEKPKDQSKDSKEGIGYSIPDQYAVLPDDYILNQEAIEDLEHAINFLNEKEQLVVSLFYKEELTLTEIGHILDLTTSRISQIHARALFKLRKSLQKLKTS